jgi:hypothetical protein
MQSGDTVIRGIMAQIPVTGGQRRVRRMAYNNNTVTAHVPDAGAASPPCITIGVFVAIRNNIELFWLSNVAPIVTSPGPLFVTSTNPS